MKDKPYKLGHTEHLARVNRIEGQVRGIKRMIEEREYCIDIITQIQAAQAALGSLGRQILEKHLDNCVKETLQSQSATDVEQKIQELMQVIKQMCR